MLRARQKLGKYRIIRRLAEGSFASVYQAQDTIEGIRVALKVPDPKLVNSAMLEDFRNEVRLTARLDHPNVLHLKNADFIGGQFVVVFPLGERTLADRLRSRLSLWGALDMVEQVLDGVAYAHGQGVIHCDIKPENLILFPDNHICLTDFGIAKVAQKTVMASGSGTVGYVAPEQAMGRPSFHSDVFSMGLVMYRMLSGQLPVWPFDWPAPGHQRLQRRIHPQMIELVRKAIEVDPRRRFRDAQKMSAAFLRAKPLALRFSPSRKKSQRNGASQRDWRLVRQQQFRREFGKVLETRHACGGCHGPVSESMQFCPWCGRRRAQHVGGTPFPAECPRCWRGVKLDWNFCAWCYGGGFEADQSRQYSDTRYEARCSNPACTRRELMPFMRYCPWCHRKVRKKWIIKNSKGKCVSCGWGTLKTYWSYCPWCGKSVG